MDWRKFEGACQRLDRSSRLKSFGSSIPTYCVLEASSFFLPKSRLPRRAMPLITAHLKAFRA